MSLMNCRTTQKAAEKVHKCDICEEIFKKKIELKRHYHEHGTRRSYQCDICGLTFSKKFNFRRHYNIHSNEKPHACDTCGQRFRWPSFLKEHENKHLMNKLFICESCNVTFTHRTTLRNHMLTHTGEKPHMCDICGKRFSKNYNLKLHRRLHTGELPFRCEHCDRSFNTKSNLKNHSYHHTGIYPFVCDVCKKGFRKKCQLLSHYDMHIEPSSGPGSTIPIKNISDILKKATVTVVKPAATVEPLPDEGSDVDDPAFFISSEPTRVLCTFKNFEPVTSSTSLSTESQLDVTDENSGNSPSLYDEYDSTNASSASVNASTSDSFKEPKQSSSPSFSMKFGANKNMDNCIKAKPYESLDPSFEMESSHNVNQSEILDCMPFPVSIKAEPRSLTPSPINVECIVNIDIDTAMKAEPFMPEECIFPGTPLKVSHPASVMSLWNLESNLRPSTENASPINAESEEHENIKTEFEKPVAETEVPLNYPASVKCNLGVFKHTAKLARSLNFEPINSECESITSTMNTQTNTHIKSEPYIITELSAGEESLFDGRFSEKSLNSPERTFNFFTSIKLDPIESS